MGQCSVTGRRRQSARAPPLTLSGCIRAGRRRARASIHRIGLMGPAATGLARAGAGRKRAPLLPNWRRQAPPLPGACERRHWQPGTGKRRCCGLVRAGVISAGLESGHCRRPQAEHIADGETPPVPDLADCNLSDAMVVVADLLQPKLRLPYWKKTHLASSTNKVQNVSVFHTLMAAYLCHRIRYCFRRSSSSSCLFHQSEEHRRPFLPFLRNLGKAKGLQ